MAGPNYRGRGRVCSKCKEFKEADGFYGNRRKCRACTRAKLKTPEGRALQRLHDRKPRNRFSSCRSQCRFTRAKWKLTFEEWFPMMSQPCFYCGDKLNETGKGLDRLDNDGHYEVGNVVPCCGACNHVRSRLFEVDEMKHILGPAVRCIKEMRKKIGGPRVSVYESIHAKPANVDMPPPEPEPAEEDFQMTIFEVME